MKTKLLLFLLLFSLTINAQTNLTPNGNFENWSSSSQPDNWFRYFSGFVSQSTSAQNGTSSTKMMIASGTFNYINSEYFPVIANKTYRITLYHKLVSGSFSAIDLSLYHKPGAFKEEIITKTDATVSSSEWRKIEFDYTPTVSENIEVDIWITGTLNSEILVDNVSVIDVATIGAEYTLIPDVNFENKLISLGIDSGVVDGKVLTSSINTLISLNVSNSSISDLTGIQDFVALQSLDCQKNNLTSLDLSKNGDLIGINCSTNKLANFINTNNLGLTHLYCSANQLTSLDVTKYIGLTNLSFSSNKITSIDISSNNLLVRLWCNSNLLTELNITNNPSLIELNCGTNQLSQLNVSKNTALTKLYCYYNQITSIDVSQNSKLEWFMCHFNQLTSIDVSNNPKLDIFDCLNNKITSLDISKNPLITELACENNQLTNLNLKNGANTILDLTYSNFANNPDLKCIQVDDVSYSNTNWLSKKDATATFNTDCTQYTLIPDANFEDKLIALEIDKDGKNGKVATSSINTVTYLDVSSSNIADMTGIQDFVALKELNCGFNQLTSLDLSKNLALSILNCNTNQLTSLEISKNETLTYLNCNQNQLTAIDVSRNIALKTFACSENQLATLEVSKNLVLNILGYSINPITSVDISKNLSLTHLYCGSTQITSLDVSANLALTHLYCEKNQLASLDISKNLALIELNCSNNLLTALNVSKNVALNSFDCSQNKLTFLDFSENMALTDFSCFQNQLTTLDVSKNVALTYLYCHYNLLTTLDLSENKKLEIVYLEFNPLTSLNIQNGNNKNFILPSVTGKTIASNGLLCSFTNNEKLSCIKVDDEAYSNANWSKIKDATATYSSTCSKLGIEDSIFDKVAIYPNPTKGELHIDNIVLEKATVYDALGKLVKTTTFTSGVNDNMMHFEGFPSGVYYIYLESEGANTAKKIMVE